MDALAALIPSAGLLILFLLLIRSILHADRRERAALAETRAQTRAGTGTRAKDVDNSVDSPEL